MATRWGGITAIGMAALVTACAGQGDGDVGAGDLPIVLDMGKDASANPDALDNGWADPGIADAGTDSIGDLAPADLGGEPDSDAADVPEMDPGQDTGTDPGKDAGTDTAADPGTGTDTAADPGNDPGTDLGTDPGTDPGMPPCDVGRDICFGTPGDGKSCASAVVIGRIQGALGTSFRSNPDTSLTDNDDDLKSSVSGGCWDAGNEFYYKVYLFPGETLNVQMIQHVSNSMVLKAYHGTSCAKDPSSFIRCEDQTTSCGENKCGNLQLTADVEGWYTVVLDGQTADDQGKHVLDFYLLGCADANCCCPY